MTECRSIQMRLEEYGVDALEEPQRRTVEEHLGECAECRAGLERVRAIEEALRAAGEEGEDPTPAEVQEYVARVVKLAARRSPRREVIPLAAAALLMVGLLIWMFAPSGRAPRSEPGQARQDSKQSASKLTRALMNQLARSIGLFQEYSGRAPADLEALTKPADSAAFWPAGGHWLGAVPRDAWGRAFLYDGGVIRSQGADGKPGGKGEDEDILVEAPPNAGSAVEPPTERLRQHYTARVHIRLLASAVAAFAEAYRELPRSLADLRTRPAWAEVWPDGGFAGSLPRDPSGKDYVLRRDSGPTRIACVGLTPIASAQLTEEERRKLTDSAPVLLTGEQEKELRRLVDRLEEEDVAAREAAARALVRMGPRAASLLADRIALEKNANVVSHLRDVLARIIVPAPSWQTELGTLSVRVLTPHPIAHPTDVCEKNLQQLWAVQLNYQAQFGGRERRFPTETGTDFWRILAKTTPPLIDASSQRIYTCPASGEEPGVCRYWGPKEDVNAYGDGDPVGMCDEAGHGGCAVVLRKCGDVGTYRPTDPIYQAALNKLKRSGDE